MGPPEDPVGHDDSNRQPVSSALVESPPFLASRLLRQNSSSYQPSRSSHVKMKACLGKFSVFFPGRYKKLRNAASADTAT